MVRRSVPGSYFHCTSIDDLRFVFGWLVRLDWRPHPSVDHADFRHHSKHYTEQKTRMPPRNFKELEFFAKTSQIS